MHGNLAITLKNCADCHKELGRFKQAYNDYSRSLEIYKVSFECIILENVNQSTVGQFDSKLNELNH